MIFKTLKLVGQFEELYIHKLKCDISCDFVSNILVVCCLHITFSPWFVSTSLATVRCQMAEAVPCRRDQQSSWSVRWREGHDDLCSSLARRDSTLHSPPVNSQHRYNQGLFPSEDLKSNTMFQSYLKMNLKSISAIQFFH